MYTFNDDQFQQIQSALNAAIGMAMRFDRSMVNKLSSASSMMHDVANEDGEHLQWRPIATAPKDGMTVDLWNSITEERRADARFINGKWRVWGQDGFENMGWVAAENQDGFTHFMHIPSSPTSSEGVQ